MQIKVEITRRENAEYFGKKIGDIVTVDMVDYIAAVGASEFASAGAEAAKAQAIAARTYAYPYFSAGKPISDASDRHQAYRAARNDAKLYPRARRAAEETDGLVLACNGKVINSCPFSAGNGGRTVSAEERWGSARAWLVAKDDPWDKAAGGGRTGHGVGMSQRGARYAGSIGKTAEEILAFYYPGTEIVRVYGEEPAPKGDEKMHQLTIYRQYLTQNRCYQSATEQSTGGVQVHSTGANNPYLKRYVQPDDGRLGVNPNGNSHNRPVGDVCASAYIGKLEDGTVAVYQTLPWNIRCWLSGSGNNGNANRMGYKGFEICEDGLNDEKYFNDAVMGKAVLLTAYICQEAHLLPDQVAATFPDGKRALAVMDHHELHGAGLASNHADITHWLKKFSRTMGDFRRAVNQVLEDGGVEVTYVGEEPAGTEKPTQAIPEEYAFTDGTTINDLVDENGELMTPVAYATVDNPRTWLNVHQGAGASYRVVGKVQKGTRAEVLDMSDPDWWEIRQGNTVGYASAQYLRLNEEAPAPQEVPEPDSNEDADDVSTIVADETPAGVPGETVYCLTDGALKEILDEYEALCARLDEALAQVRKKIESIAHNNG